MQYFLTHCCWFLCLTSFSHSLNWNKLFLNFVCVWLITTVISADMNNEIEQETLSSGALCSIRKPIKPNDLNTISKHIDHTINGNFISVTDAYDKNSYNNLVFPSWSLYTFWFKICFVIYIYITCNLIIHVKTIQMVQRKFRTMQMVQRKCRTTQMVQRKPRRQL